MPVTADLRQAINRGENADVLEEIALTHGMKTLRMSAIDYALRRNHHRRGSAACGIR